MLRPAAVVAFLVLGGCVDQTTYRGEDTPPHILPSFVVPVGETVVLSRLHRMDGDIQVLGTLVLDGARLQATRHPVHVHVEGRLTMANNSAMYPLAALSIDGGNVFVERSELIVSNITITGSGTLSVGRFGDVIVPAGSRIPALQIDAGSLTCKSGILRGQGLVAGSVFLGEDGSARIIACAVDAAIFDGAGTAYVGAHQPVAIVDEGANELAATSVSVRSVVSGQIESTAITDGQGKARVEVFLYKWQAGATQYQVPHALDIANRTVVPPVFALQSVQEITFVAIAS